MNINRLAFLLLMLASVGSANAQLYDFDAVERNRMAKAKVKVQTQWTHDYVDGKPSAKGYKTSVTKYNAMGNVTEVTNYNKEGKVILMFIYQYDSRGNKVNHEQYQGNRNKLQYSQRAEYDAGNNKTRESGFDGATTYSNTFQYNDAGKLGEIVYTQDNAVVEKRKLSYKGNITEIQIFDTGNNLTFKQENTYDDRGRLVSEVKTGGTGNIVHTMGFEYNTVGDLTEEIKKRAGDKLDYQKLYHYDSANRPVREETVNLDGTKYISHEYQYNASGDLILESWRKNGKAKEASSKKITYDSKNIYTEMEYYYTSYKLYSLYKYTYEFY